MKAESAATLLSQGRPIPPQSDAALLLRHAQRETIPPNSFGADTQLTTHGVNSAERLGRLLSARQPGLVASSPVRRCLDTAQAISRGAGWPAAITPDWRLGNPGPFVAQPKLAGPLFLQTAIPQLVRRQLLNAHPPPGMRTIAEGAQILLDFISGQLDSNGRVNLYVTHDAILAPLIGWLFHLPVYREGWPDFLDTMLLWRDDGRLHLAWRGLHQTAHPPGG